MTKLDNDLISRKALLEAIKAELPNNGLSAEGIMRKITNAPTIESEASSRVDSGEAVGEVKSINEDNDEWLSKLPVGTKLYTSPQKREWVELAVEDEFLLYCNEDEFLEIARAVSRKLKEVNHG